jgi:hypothetical protein
MRDYTLAHLSDEVLLRDLAALMVRERVTTATLLAHIGEVDARRLYVPAGYPSMHAYCVDELRLSEDAAYKRIQAARAARQFPALFLALAEGRLHLAGACLLAPHLTPGTAEELIEAATHRRKSEIEELLALRFPSRAIPVLRSVPQLAPGQVHVESAGADPGQNPDPGPDPDPNSNLLAPGQVAGLSAEGAPPFAERFLLQLTIAKSTREKLVYAQELLSHTVPSGDLAQVVDRALDALIAQLEKRKLGAVSRRGYGATQSRPSTTGSRTIPAQVRRAVWERDRGQCTFIGAKGHRCGARRFLEFDHVHPVARGGTATVEGMRLRCRAHNQYEAERAFGAAFMSRKRHEARQRSTPQLAPGQVAEARARVLAESRARALANEQARDVWIGLRGLGCPAEEARRAAEFSRTLKCATLEERMRAALAVLRRRSTRAHR